MIAYNVVICSLTILGVTGLFVYSRRLSRSRVYPVGIVRTHPRANLENPRVEQLPTEAELKQELCLCSQCGLVQESSQGLLCAHCGHELLSLAIVTKTKSDLIKSEGEELESQDSAQLKAKVLGHEKALNSHDVLLRNLEKRIRELEAGSVRRLAEPELAKLDTGRTTPNKGLVN